MEACSRNAGVCFDQTTTQPNSGLRCEQIDNLVCLASQNIRLLLRYSAVVSLHQEATNTAIMKHSQPALLLFVALAPVFGGCAVFPAQRLKHGAARDSQEMSSPLIGDLLERDTCGPGPACGELA